VNAGFFTVRELNGQVGFGQSEEFRTITVRKDIDAQGDGTRYTFVNAQNIDGNPQIISVVIGTDNNPDVVFAGSDALRCTTKAGVDRTTLDRLAQ
jgi:hypothetical protein